MLGIGLGAFADGLQKGVGLADKLDAQSRKRAVDDAVTQGQSDYNDAVAGGTEQPNDPNALMRFTSQKVMGPLIANGDLEGAQKASAWLTNDETRRATEAFGRGMVAAQSGDMKTALDNFVQAGRTKGYGPDMTLSDPQPIDGGGYKVNATFKGGNTVSKVFKTPDEVIQFGATNLNPVQAFQTRQAEITADQDANRKVRTTVASHEGVTGIDFADTQRRIGAGIDSTTQQTKGYQARKTIDEDFADLEAAKGRDPVSRATQTYQNRKDIDRQYQESDANDADQRALEKYKGQKGIDLQAEKDRKAAGLGSPDYSFQNIQQVGPDGKPIVKPYRFSARTGTVEPVTDAEGNPVDGQLAGKGGSAGGRDSVFKQKLQVGNALYGENTKEAADYANGRRQLTPGEAVKFGTMQAETELRNDPTISDKFRKAGDRNAWKDQRAKEIAGTLMNAQTPAAPAKSGSGLPPADSVSGPTQVQNMPTDLGGVGTRKTPFQATTQAHIDWFKQNAQPGQVIIVNGQPFTK